MKYLFYLLVTVFALQISIPTVQAITVTPTVSPSPAADEEKDLNVLKNLKDQIATRVAQLKLVQKKGIIGTVDTISGTQITVTDTNKQQHIIDVDELTKFSSPTEKNSFGISDLTKGTNVDVLGLYNKQTKHTLARFINVVTIPRFLQGEIASIDADEFTITVISDTGTLTTVAIENITKTFIYSKEDGLQKAGFTKIEPLKQVVVIGFSDKNNPKKIIASRVLIFPDVPKNPRIIIPQQALDPEEDVTISTGSGRKLTPIIR
ncbi:MAG: hypothetical protein KBD46_00885 [Candidatus Levybacteria bacterium]|nr:hypothetical protein [Candidatus Levybacteria bacterium]